MSDIGGVWRTIGGRRVFIKNGQSLADAMKDSGKFPSHKKESPYDSLMGQEYIGFKGQAAIDKLLEEKQGHVKAAFYHPDIGDIDIFWGDDSAGLCHILSQRRAQKIDARKLISEISQTIERGKSGIDRSNPDRENIFFKDRVIVITYELRGQETIAILTAFRAKNKFDEIGRF